MKKYFKKSHFLSQKLIFHCLKTNISKKSRFFLLSFTWTFRTSGTYCFLSVISCDFKPSWRFEINDWSFDWLDFMWFLMFFLWLHSWFQTKWFNDSTSEWPLASITNKLATSLHRKQNGTTIHIENLFMNTEGQIHMQSRWTSFFLHVCRWSYAIEPIYLRICKLKSMGERTKAELVLVWPQQ